MVSGWPIKYASANAVENELIYAQLPVTVATRSAQKSEAHFSMYFFTGGYRYYHVPVIPRVRIAHGTAVVRAQASLLYNQRAARHSSIAGGSNSCHNNSNFSLQSFLYNIFSPYFSSIAWCSRKLIKPKNNASCQYPKKLSHDGQSFPLSKSHPEPMLV